jgi:hypothetical protein
MNLGIGILKRNIYFVIAFFRHWIGRFIIVQIISAAPSTKSDYMAKNLENRSRTVGRSFDSSVI